jgi:hypothetical protein
MPHPQANIFGKHFCVQQFHMPELSSPSLMTLAGKMCTTRHELGDELCASYILLSDG